MRSIYIKFDDGKGLVSIYFANTQRERTLKTERRYQRLYKTSRWIAVGVAAVAKRTRRSHDQFSSSFRRQNLCNPKRLQ